MAKTFAVPPPEPVLQMDDIQGAVVPGFLKPHQTLIGLQIRQGALSLHRFKSLLRKLPVSTGRETLEDRRRFRSGKGVTRRSDTASGTVLVGIGFTSGGLLRLAPSSSQIPSEAFQAGLAKRSALLGDPIDSKSPGNPTNWRVGGPGSELDVLVVVAGDRRAMVNKRVAELITAFGKAGLAIPYCEDGDVLPGSLQGHEHFGFNDGISQPGIRGLDWSGAFITERHISPEKIPEAWLCGYPGQDLVWPGEFVVGYPKSGPDPLLPVPADPPEPCWTRNGAFLVFRRLRQDVRLFWKTMHDEAQGLSGSKGFESMNAIRLASLLVGRWPSGAPVNRTPSADSPSLGGDPFSNNSFLFDSDTPCLPLLNGGKDGFPQAKADPVGITCPWAAHIRKLNTRDSASDLGGRESTQSRRILRVGVPYGKPLFTSEDARDLSLEELLHKMIAISLDPDESDERYPPISYGQQSPSSLRPNEDQRTPGNDRGVLFLALQASIDQQFEFLMSRWVNSAARPKMPGGNDMLVGQSAAAENGTRKCVLFGSGFETAVLQSDKQWVTPTGGGYFFMPSISAMQNELSQ